MDNRQKNEDNKIKKYEMEKEMRERVGDEMKFKKVKQTQA